MSNNKSIAERKKEFLEDCCGGAGGGMPMSGGDAMYTGEAPAEGPFAGYDKPLGDKKKKKGIVGMARRLRGK